MKNKIKFKNSYKLIFTCFHEINLSNKKELKKFVKEKNYNNLIAVINLKTNKQLDLYNLLK